MKLDGGEPEVLEHPPPILWGTLGTWEGPRTDTCLGLGGCSWQRQVP